MLAAAIIVFREVIEAGLIVGIVLAATRGVQSRTVYVLGGIAAGIFGASLLAVFAGTLSNALEGVGQEVFNASILGVAVIMLGWHNVWMAQHGRELAAELAAAGRAVVAGSKTLTALALSSPSLFSARAPRLCCSSMASLSRVEKAAGVSLPGVCLASPQAFQ